ncbi:MAG: Two-component sensor CbrA: intrcellular carbon:nitrogen balance [Olavius algarvensis Gamma 3 endosymbiont]|nr:MAG: Two-component sensor CbrA: intrcellular carbon:nitrogen balance [Olavius algarvensis Gamma 3 endosymbiont]
MQFELWQLFVVGVLYLGLLFVIATATDRGWIPESIVSHPLVYTLSIGVYATSWSFYGSVGFAQKEGYNFLTIYLGTTLAFVASPILLRPILKITETYRLASLADLFAFRYHSQLAGVLVTLLVLTGTLPYISLQIQAVTNTLQIMTNETEQQLIALMFCIIVGLFSILFGTRHISLREKHRGLVVAIAFESLVKLVTLLSVGLFAIFGIFGGFGELNQYLQQHPEANEALFAPVTDGPWATLMLLSFAAAFLLPRQFHMIFVESIKHKNIETASWAFPLFLLLLNLSIPPILWAGQSLQLTIPADFFVLGITLDSGSSVLPILTFMGGLSAASAMIIVTTLALASMCMNNFVLPASFPPKLSTGTSMYEWLLWGRRIVIMSIVGIGYFFYLVQQHNPGLAGLGLISFVAVAQCLPGVVGLLYWSRANKNGFIAGLVVGATIWAVTLFVPLFERAGIIETPYFTIPELAMSTTDAALWSLVLNSLTFVIVSLLSRQSAEEREVAEACSRESFLIPQGAVKAASIAEFEQQLSTIVGQDIAHNEVNRALADLGLVPGEVMQSDLTRLRAQIDRNLSGLVGPVLSRMIVNEHLQIDGATQSALADTIQFVGNTQEKSRDKLRGVSSELDALRRFHFQVLQDLPLGAVSIDNANNIVSWNKQLSKLTGIEQHEAIGKSIDQLQLPWRELLAGFIASDEFLVGNFKFPIHGQIKVLNLFKAEVRQEREGNSGIAILIEDHSESYSLEEKLAHSERLASIGQLATGVAHEIGNPVTGIACLAQDLRSDLRATPEVSEGLNQILTQTDRISRIVGSLSNYGHAGAPDEYPAENLDLEQIVGEAINLVSLSQSGKQMNYQHQCEGGVFVSGYAQKLVQVFVNLLTNATDASEPGQTITIETGIDANQVTITVSDRGKGIAEEHLSKIFEPFFTTKMVGEGTGLGLSLAYNIIQEHGGSISVSSKYGQGCRFDIVLPGFDASRVAQA